MFLKFETQKLRKKNYLLLLKARMKFIFKIKLTKVFESKFLFQIWFQYK